MRLTDTCPTVVPGLATHTTHAQRVVLVAVGVAALAHRSLRVRCLPGACPLVVTRLLAYATHSRRVVDPQAVLFQLAVSLTPLLHLHRRGIRLEEQRSADAAAAAASYPEATTTRALLFHSTLQSSAAALLSRHTALMQPRGVVDQPH
jgi:hypothetical protein